MKYYRTWIISCIVVLAALIISIISYNRLSQWNNLQNYQQIPFNEQVQSLAYDEETNHLYIGSYQNRVAAITTEGEELWSFATGNVVTDIELGEKEAVVYAASDDQNVYVLNKHTGERIKTLSLQRRVYDIDVMEDAGLMVISAGINSNKHYVFLYTLAGELLWRDQLSSTSRAVNFSNDGQHILVGTDRAELITYTLKGEKIRSIKLKSAIKGMGINKKDGSIAALTEYGTFYLLDANSSILFTKQYDFQENTTGFAADTDFSSFALGGRFGEFYIIDKKGEVIVQDDRKKGFSSFYYAKDILYTGSLGEPIYKIPIKAFKNSKIIAFGLTMLSILLYILPVAVIAFGLLSFQRTRDFACKAGKTFYKHKTAYLLLLPTFTMLIIFMFYPIVIAFIRGFTDWNVRSEEIQFVGFQNFTRMITEGYFLLGLKNLGILALADFIKVLTIPLIIAELVFALKLPKMKYWFRFFFVLPMVIPGIVTILMWKNIYDPAIGLLNNLLGALNLENLQRVWLGDPKTALGAIIGMNFPYIDGFAFLVYYGGLINIPSQLFEAAKVDGAGRFWNFTHIHLPLLTPQFKMLIILKFIGSIQNFMPIYILTGGGPGEVTYVPGLELYYHATTFGNYGYACALGISMFVFIFIGTYFNMKLRTQSQE